MDEKIDLSKGGMAIVGHGATGFVKEYQSHPQVKFLDCKELSILEPEVPHNTKVVVITDGLPNYHLTWLTSYARRKSIPFLVRKSNQSVYETLKSFFPSDVKVTVEEIKETLIKGKLNFLIDKIDFNKSNAENANILLRLCKENNVSSTFASLTQFVSIQRRKQSGTAIVRSARPKLDVSVEILENMIKELTDMKEFLLATVEENRVLKIKLERFKKAMED